MKHSIDYLTTLCLLLVTLRFQEMFLHKHKTVTSCLGFLYCSQENHLLFLIGMCLTRWKFVLCVHGLFS